MNWKVKMRERRQVAVMRVKDAIRIIFGRAIQAELTWQKLCQETERKWEKVYEGACEGRDRMRERAEQWEKLAGEQRERSEKLFNEYVALREQVRKAEGDLLLTKGQLETSRQANDSLRRGLEQLQKGRDVELERAKEFEERLGAAYHRQPSIVVETAAGKGKRDVERLLVLAGRAESDPLWATILSYADEHERTEREAALKPEAYPAGALHAGRAMTDGERHYNAGRAASAYDFATALRDLLAEAQVEARRLKGEK